MSKSFWKYGSCCNVFISSLGYVQICVNESLWFWLTRLGLRSLQARTLYLIPGFFEWLCHGFLRFPLTWSTIRHPRRRWSSWRIPCMWSSSLFFPAVHQTFPPYLLWLMLDSVPNYPFPHPVTVLNCFFWWMQWLDDLWRRLRILSLRLVRALLCIFLLAIPVLIPIPLSSKIRINIFRYVLNVSLFMTMTWQVMFCRWKIGTVTSSACGLFLIASWFIFVWQLMVYATTLNHKKAKLWSAFDVANVFDSF